MKARYPHILLASVGLTAFSAGAALAQAPAAANRVQVEEIVVTAQRREENLQAIPIAVSAVTGATAERLGISDVRALEAIVPSLQINRQASSTIPFLRGVGTPQGAPGAEPSVALYVDGIYYPSAKTNLQSFNNIERVEVLKGPQGTLFGRNAVGGVINILTKKPSFETQGKVSLGYGAFNTTEGSLYVTAGLSESVAASLSIYGYKQAEGWGTNINTLHDSFTQQDFSARAKLLWQASDQTEVLLGAAFNRSRGELGIGYRYTPSLTVRGPDGVTRTAGYYDTTSDIDDHFDSKNTVLTGRLDHDLGWAKFVSLTGYQRTSAPYVNDLDATPAGQTIVLLDTHYSTFTQEFQLNSATDSRLNWVLGAFYFHDVAQFDDLNQLGSAIPTGRVTLSARQKIQSYAAFGQATYGFTDRTRLTVGLRYTYDDRKVRGRTVLATGTVAAQGAQGSSQGQMTWRLALDHDLTDDIMTYASYTRGFKSGGFALTNYTNPAVDPEILDSYEVGFKSNLLDHRLRFNAAAFYYDYKNIQLTVRQVVNGVLSSPTINAAEARLYGLDLDMEAVPVENLTLRGGLVWEHSEYRKFPNAVYFLINNGSFPGCATVNCQFSRDASGNRTIRTPKLTFNISADYVYPTAWGEWRAAVNYARVGSFFWDPDNIRKQQSYGLVNGSLGASFSTGWDVSLWARNLTDEKYLSYISVSAVVNGYTPAPPRTYGATLTRRF